MNIKLLKIHKFIKINLNMLGIETYDDAKHLIEKEEKNATREQHVFNGKKYELSYYCGIYPPNDEIIIAAYVIRKRLICNEGFSAGIHIRKNEKPKYYSQKQLWEAGF